MKSALSRLERAAGAMGLALPPGALDQCEALLKELLVWRRRMNLTSAATADALVTLHFVDSLIPLTVVKIPQGGRLADVGSGAGFPGLPMKIARPDLDVTLIEATNRRAAFLEHAVRVLRVQGVTVALGRAEDLGRRAEYRERFDAVVSRAVGRAGVGVELCLPLAAEGGVVVLLKGPRAREELAAARPLIERMGGALEEIAIANLPLTGQRRLIAVISKQRPIAPEYPRRGARLGR